jgi:aquaporin Z
MGSVSGAHLNPAVTFAFALRRSFPWCRVPEYVLAQCVGSLMAVAFFWSLFGAVAELGASTPQHGVTSVQALFIETILTSALVNTILGTASGARNIGTNAVIAVGSYIALAGLWASPLTGASMNPARSPLISCEAICQLRGFTSWAHLPGRLSVLDSSGF